MGLKCKVGSQEIHRVTGKLGLGDKNESGQRITVLPGECSGHRKCSFPTTQETTLYRTSQDGQTLK